METRTAALANEIGRGIVVHHLPPGTSNGTLSSIARSSFVSLNGKVKPLVSSRVIVDLIGATTETGLTVRCEVDGRT
jgi:hypothetical protein